MQVRQLEPLSVWNHFEDLNAVPRPSKKEERVRAFMKNFGAKLGLEVVEDQIGNIVIKKPASAGMENRQTTIIQTHLDMVHQKNSDTNFDFLTQGIQSFIDGEWVTAKGTTLGADNGMGVASAMALLSSTNISHPALECLFTIDEETGMTGAKELDGSMLAGTVLLNLDTEDDDEISIGCAGGIDTNTKYTYQSIHTPPETKAFEIKLFGLKGGHSGMEINLGRGNANLLLNRLLHNITLRTDIGLSAFDGGSLRNAIPREARCVITVPNAEVPNINAIVSEETGIIANEYSVVEPNFKVTCTETDLPESILHQDEFETVIESLYNTPNGVWKMSDKIEGLVETSSSLARVIIKDGSFETQSLQRSMIESGKHDVANAMRINYDRIGAEVIQNGDYPGWAPNPDSNILKVVVSKYESLFHETPNVQACHAGLECGILQKHIKDCDMVSFGPTIRNPHSPDEKVSIASVQKFWGYLLEVLKDIPLK